ncbi:DMT family transporter [Aquimarina sp. W85]|uniref:DMT family transporter n=1 Tax=Aquimarina rhodophyticola TaxID=3342246 RepID=UPI00366F7A9B
MKQAVYFMIISAISFTLMNLFIKHLVHFSAAQLIMFRSFGSLIFTMTYLHYKKINIVGNKHKLLFLRGLAGVSSMGLFFLAVPYLPIGTAVSLRYTAPIFATLLAVLMLRERIAPIQWLFIILAFAGVIVIKGFDSNINLIGLTLILCSAIASSLVYIIINKIGHSDHPVVIVNYFMWISFLVGSSFSIFYWTTPIGIEWLLLLSLGVFGYFGQLFMTKAFQSQKTNKIVSLKYIEVISTMLAGVLWFGDQYSISSMVGIGMIITGLILNIFYKSK